MHPLIVQPGEPLYPYGVSTWRVGISRQVPYSKQLNSHTFAMHQTNFHQARASLLYNKFPNYFSSHPDPC
jgi:hypothetical protein